jgi:hypothetical protein
MHSALSRRPGRCGKLRLLCTVGVFIAQVTPTATADEAADAARVSCVAYRANMASLQTFKCRYVYTRANAKNLEAALAGAYTDVRMIVFDFVRDGKRQRFENVTPIDVTPPKNSPAVERVGRVGVAYHPTEFTPIADLRLGEEGLHYLVPWKRVTVTDSGETARLPYSTPLSIVGWENVLGPTKQLELTDSGNATFSSGGVIQIREQPCVHAQFKSEKWGNQEFYFAPGSGYVPIFIRERLPTVQEVQTQVLEVRDVGDHRWFPIHIVQVTLGRTPDGPVRVLDIHATELQMDKVKDEDLAISVPAGARVEWLFAERHESERLDLRQNEKLIPDDIPKMKELLARRAQNPLADTAVGPSDQSRRTSKWYFVAAAALFFLLAVVVFRRTRRRTTS